MSSIKIEVSWVETCEERGCEPNNQHYNHIHERAVYEQKAETKYFKLREVINAFNDACGEESIPSGCTYWKDICSQSFA